MSFADRSPRIRTKPGRPGASATSTPRLTLGPPEPGLRGILRSIDGGPFQAYRRVLGEHEVGEFRLTVLSVPPDALGGPARIRLASDRHRAGLDGDWWRGDTARVVLEDAIVRAAARAVCDIAGPGAGAAPGSGRVWIDPPGPELAERTSARVGEERIDVALAFELPASARRGPRPPAAPVPFQA